MDVGGTSHTHHARLSRRRPPRRAPGPDAPTPTTRTQTSLPYAYSYSTHTRPRFARAEIARACAAGSLSESRAAGGCRVPTAGSFADSDDDRIGGQTRLRREGWREGQPDGAEGLGLARRLLLSLGWQSGRHMVRHPNSVLRAEPDLELRKPPSKSSAMFAVCDREPGLRPCRPVRARKAWGGSVGRPERSCARASLRHVVPTRDSCICGRTQTAGGSPPPPVAAALAFHGRRVLVIAASGLESETPGESRATRTLGSGPRLGGRGSRAAACETVPSRGSPGHVCRGVGRAP